VISACLVEKLFSECSLYSVKKKSQHLILWLNILNLLTNFVFLSTSRPEYVFFSKPDVRRISRLSAKFHGILRARGFLEMHGSENAALRKTQVITFDLKESKNKIRTSKKT